MTILKPIRRVALRTVFFTIECGLETINFAGSRILARLDDCGADKEKVAVRASLIP